MSDIGPGLHTLDFAKYAALPYINSGAVNKAFTKRGQISMKHFHAAIEGRMKSDDTEDRKLGRAIHCRLLEPERYRTDFLVATTCRAVKQDGQQCGNTARLLWDGEWYCGVRGHAPKGASEPADYIAESERQRIEALCEALHTNDVFQSGLFRRPGWHEASGIWEERGMRCKCRIDRLDESKPIVIDLKKIQVGTGDRETCEEKIRDYGWYRQAAMYVKCIEALLEKTPEFVWVFVEDDEPYDVQVIPADSQTIAIGRHEVDDVLGRYAVARQAGKFKGYIYDSRFIRPGGLPLRYRQQCEAIGIGVGESSGTGDDEYADFGDAPPPPADVD